jgi:hypothetical protein
MVSVAADRAPVSTRASALVGGQRALAAASSGRRVPYSPLPWGDLDAPCEGCDARPGMLHRLGCRRERCRRCGDTRARCGHRA